LGGKGPTTKKLVGMTPVKGEKKKKREKKTNFIQ